MLCIGATNTVVGRLFCSSRGEHDVGEGVARAEATQVDIGVDAGYFARFGILPNGVTPVPTYFGRFFGISPYVERITVEIGRQISVEERHCAVNHRF